LPNLQQPKISITKPMAIECFASPIMLQLKSFGHHTIGNKMLLVATNLAIENILSEIMW
jgi:hypothetical protein